MPLLPTTAKAMSDAITKLVQVEISDLYSVTGDIRLTTSQDPEVAELLRDAGAMALYDAGSDSRRAATYFFTDRIPAGLEERVFLRETVRLHAQRTAPGDWGLVMDAVERWGSFGAALPAGSEMPAERQVYDAVATRIKGLKARGQMRWTERDARFVFAVQEAVTRGVVPDGHSQGIEGWLQTVFDTVQNFAHAALGSDLQDFEGRQYVELLQLGTPFHSEIEQMRSGVRALREKEKVATQRDARMRLLDARYEQHAAKQGSTAIAAQTREAALERRIAELTSQLGVAQEAITSLAYQDRGKWYMGGYRGDEVTGTVEGAVGPQSMNGALWDIKALVEQPEIEKRYVGSVASELEELADGGLATGSGTPQEREALKRILSIAQQAGDSSEPLPFAELRRQLAAGLPLVSAVADLGAAERPTHDSAAANDTLTPDGSIPSGGFGVAVPATAPPPMPEGEFGWPMSKPVLGYEKGSGLPVLVTFERQEDDEPVKIISKDSERWDLTGKISHWTEIPDLESLRVTTPTGESLAASPAEKDEGPSP